MNSTSENKLVFRNSCVLKSSCITYTLRLCARHWLILTKNKSVFKSMMTCFISTMIFSLPLRAADVENGKVLHDTNCLRCHNESLYTRENRIVNHFGELRERVRLCELSTEMAWFEEEIDDVTAYLNQTFYHFKLEK